MILLKYQKKNYTFRKCLASGNKVILCKQIKMFKLTMKIAFKYMIYFRLKHTFRIRSSYELYFFSLIYVTLLLSTSLLRLFNITHGSRRHIFFSCYDFLYFFPVCCCRRCYRKLSATFNRRIFDFLHSSSHIIIIIIIYTYFFHLV